MLGKLTLDGVTKSAFGGSLISFRDDGTAISIGDDLKAAASDCLKKSASLFGVGLELYGGKAAVEPSEPSEPRPKARVQEDPKNRATVRQVAALQGAARRRGLTRDRFSLMLRERTGKSDVAELDRVEASHLIAELSNSNGTGN